MFSNKPAIWARRVTIYIFGLLLLAMGAVVAVKSNLGISPVNSVPYVLSCITPYEQGFMTTLVFCVYIILQVFLLRKEFQLVQLTQILCAALFGYFITLWTRLLYFPAPESYVLRLLLTFFSILLIGAGMTLYLCANLIPQPAEGLCLAIQRKTGWKYSNIKVAFDCIMVGLSALLSLWASGHISGVREGTIIAMFSVGYVIGFLSKKWKAQITLFCESGFSSKTGSIASD